ncbi:DUF3397 domain-containing protein [Lactobacillaceae bacterium L1_55_11]|nr:DUF3397 domain-containing protein [Lactobacillaceae bacterium L1_55_11]
MWYWIPIIWILVLGGLYLLRRYWHRYPNLTWLDFVVLPNWLALYFTAGLAFTPGYFFWFLLVWLLIGWFLSWFLLRREWPYRVFWHRYWQWSGLIAALAEIIVAIAALIMGFH